MKIRKAKLKDVNEIVRLLRETKELDSGSGSETLLYGRNYVIGSIKDKSHNIMLVVEEDKKVIGFLNAEIWKGKGFSFLDNIAFLEGYRRKGYGSKLVDYYVNLCRKMRLKSIVTLVLQDNKKMIKFCKKHGFKQGDPLFALAKLI